MRLGSIAGVVAMSALVLAGCGDDGDSATAFCTAATDVESFAAVFESFDPDDHDAALDAFREARSIEIELRRHAPDAVRADLDLLVQFLDDVVEGLEAADPDADERPAIYDKVATRIDQIEAASDRVETYVDANC